MPKPPFEITQTILKETNEISLKLGEAHATHLEKSSPQLRKENRIKTIQASLQIEGNTLSIDQVTALIENKRVIGDEREIIEVKNAVQTYKRLSSFDCNSEQSFLLAHKVLMQGLIAKPGNYRTKSVGITKGEKLTHLAPPASRVKELMKNLFKYLKNSKDLILIKSCVFHYEMEFIHPFLDGNGRMGRLWQTSILMKEYPIFEFLPFETIISKNQAEYYNALSISDKAGSSTAFIEFMLQTIDLALSDLLNIRRKTLSEEERIEYFLSKGVKEFTRSDYMKVFKVISTATASRDLKRAVTEGKIKLLGTKRLAKYSIV